MNMSGKNTISQATVMRLNRLPGASRCLQIGDILHLSQPPFGNCSVELHINLRHYRNYQAWDWYLLNNQLTGGSLKLGITDQLWNGEAILCCCRETGPCLYSEATCGAVTLKTEALRDGWQCSNGKYWYCPVCKVIRNITPSSNKFRLLTPDSL